MKLALSLLTLGVLALFPALAEAQYPYDPYYGPVPAYYAVPAPTVVYRPVYPVYQVAAPVYLPPPPVVVYRPAPVPVVVGYPAPVYYRARPYIPGQPVRNVVRAVVW